MNILQAFEKSDEAKIYEGLSGITYRFKKSDPKGSIPFYLTLLDTWEPVIEPLTFERIKRECTPGETLFNCIDGTVRLYLGFTRNGSLATDSSLPSAMSIGLPEWEEKDVKNWQIFSEKWEG